MRFLLAGALLLELAACGGGAERPPNVLLVSLDTLRADALSSHGNPRPLTPALDGLAAAGVRFADCSSTAPWTLPAHASLFTGTYPRTHGVKGHERRLPDDLPTLAQVLRDAGYATAAVVNTHHLGDPRYGLQAGFGDVEYVEELVEGKRLVANRGEEVNARAFARLAGIRRPFLLFLHYYDAHSAYRAGEPYESQLVDPYDGPLRGTTMQLSRYRRRGETIGGDDARWLRQMYEAEVRRLDDLVGELLARLDELGLAEDTYVVVTSDHGEEFGEHGGALHGRSQYQELLHVPWLVRGPGVAAGLVVEEPVGLVDVAPTVLGLLGREVPAAWEGEDLSAVVRGATPAPAGRALFAEADHENWIDGQAHADVTWMVRVGARKLCFDEVRGRWELFDLEADPRERVDRSDLEPEVLADLRARLERFRAAERPGVPIEAPDEALKGKLERLGY